MALAAASAALGCRAKNDADRKPPRVAFAAESRDFGSVGQGTVVGAEFPFRNDGEFDLEIGDLRTAGDCAARIEEGTRIKPARAGVVRASFETAAAFGDQQRTITVYTNDPDRRVVTLEMHGQVLLDVAADPPRLYTGPLLRGAQLPHAISVRTDGETRATAARSTKPLLEVALVDRAAAGAPADSSAPPSPTSPQIVSVAIAPDAPLGPFDAEIEVVTTSGQHPVVRVPVNGVVDPDLNVIPGRMQFGSVIAGAAATRLAMLQNLRADHPVRVSRVEIDPRLGSARVETLEEGLRYRIETKLSDRLPPGPFSGALHVFTDHPSQPIVEIPLEGVVDSGAGEGSKSQPPS